MLPALLVRPSPRPYAPRPQAEIMEIQGSNKGAGFATFLKRGPLPKAAPAAAGAALPGAARLTAEQCYAPTDMNIGATITILGRQFLIYDCDDATRKWYMVRRGLGGLQQERGRGGTHCTVHAASLLGGGASPAAHLPIHPSAGAPGLHARAAGSHRHQRA